MAFSRTMDYIVQGVNTLIVAPPGYGKRKFILRNRHREPFNDFFDTESVLRSRPNRWYGIITEHACLIPKAELSFIFLPPREYFLAGCLAAGVESPETMYSDYLQYAKSATYVITSGDSMLFYQRFIDKAISHFFDGEPILPVPTFQQGYRADPAYSTVSIPPPPIQPTRVEVSTPMRVEASTSVTPAEISAPDDQEPTTSASSSLDLDVETRNIPHASPSTIIDVVSEYSNSSVGNQDLEAADTSPDAAHLLISQLFTKKFDIIVVPVSVGFSSSKGAVRFEYFGGNFVKIGPIYMSLLVMCQKRFDNGTVQFSPPDWLVH